VLRLDLYLLCSLVYFKHNGVALPENSKCQWFTHARARVSVSA